MADTMDNQECALEWLRFAEMDLGVAEHSLSYYPLPSEIICYHCQQSAEKCLKAVLVMQGIRPPKIHELDTLYHLCEPFTPNIQTIWDACTFLNRYSVMPRYPNELMITETTVPVTLAYAKKIMDIIRPIIHVYQ
jgi:HEPN domain-containing protein